jgi:YHS domain-containing protein
MNIKSIIALIAAGFTTSSAFAADPSVPKDYPLTKCPVSGEAYGEGGMKAFKVTHEGTDVWLCCKGCKKDFDKEPAKFAAAVKAGAAKK